MSDDKREYVQNKRREGRADGHRCHWPGCPESCPAACWGCLRHWKMLPRQLQQKIWQAFRPGQEVSKTPSREYVAAAREVQAWIRDNYPQAAHE